MNSSMNALHNLIFHQTPCNLRRHGTTDLQFFFHIIIPATPEPIFPPPTEPLGAEAEQVVSSFESTSFQIETQEKDIESGVDDGVNGVGHDVAAMSLPNAEKAEDDQDQVEEVGQHGQPQVAQKVEDLSLCGAQ